nr:LysE family transporter [Gammaproteobacteria bacterium]
LQIVSALGALILIYFAISALRLPASEINLSNCNTKARPLWRHYSEGLLLTIFNPYTILFWASISSLVINISQQPNGIWFIGLGVLISTASWVAALNLVVHYSKHRITPKAMHWINRCGGIILLGFAILSFWRAFN